MRELIETRLARPRPPADPRARLLANVLGEVSPELKAILDRPSSRAAVLVPLVERSAGLYLLFTERAAHLKHHAGQISFPGGRIELPGESVVAAALREAREEIGLAGGDVSVAGTLDSLVTGTGFDVTPVVGFVAGSFVARPDPAEVESVFEVPLEFFLDVEPQRTEHERYSTRIVSYEFHYGGQRIWGATAAMLMNLRAIVNTD